MNCWQKTLSLLNHRKLEIILIVLALHPWLLFGVHGPVGDGATLYWASYKFFGFAPMEPDQQLFGNGPTFILFLFRYLVPEPTFILVAASVLMVTFVGLYLLLFHLLQNYVSRMYAFIVVAIWTLHPLLQHGATHWLKDNLYALSFLASLFLGARYIEARTWRNALAFAFMFSFSWIIRRQALSTIYLFLLFAFLYFAYLTYTKKLALKECKQIALQLFVIVAVPALLTLPIRLRHLAVVGKPILAVSAGWNINMAVANLKLFSPDNGPTSTQLMQMAQAALASGDEVIRPAAERIVTGGFAYHDPIALFQFFKKGDAIAADNFAVKIYQEAIRREWRKYLAYSWKSLKFHLVGYSDNPAEYRTHIIGRQAGEARDQLVFEGGKVVLPSFHWRGLLDRNPSLRKIFFHWRGFYWKTMTWLKRFSILAVPLIFFLLWRQQAWSYARFFLLVTICHYATVVALSFMVGFGHRYSAPFELFSVLYLGIAAFLLHGGYRVIRIRFLG